MLSRLHVLQEKLARSERHFALSIGINPVTYHNIANGSRKPSLDLVTKILSSFPQVNAYWLILGNGKPFRNGFNDDGTPSTFTNDQRKEHDEILTSIAEGFEQLDELQRSMNELRAKLEADMASVEQTDDRK